MERSQYVAGVRADAETPVQKTGLAVASLGVVVVTFHPTGEVEHRLQRMRSQGGALVVIDNASGREQQDQLRALCDRHGWSLIPNAVNRGLGYALNQGVRHLAQRGFAWALLFDQDSEPAPGMSQHMMASLQRHPESDRVAVIGASFREPATGRRHRVLRRHPWLPAGFQKIAPGEDDLLEVSAVITSGSMVRIADFDRLGGFDEDLFIDYVDTDFCLRCLRGSRWVAVSAAAQFDHAFGRRTVNTWCGIEIQPTNHSALRHYYIARNRVAMWQRHAWRLPHWAAFDLATVGLWLFRVLTVEDQKRLKLRAMVLGTWDGLLGVLGPCPARRAAVLSAT